MATVNLTQDFKATLDNELYEIGSATTPISVTITSELAYRRSFSVATATIQNVYQRGTSFPDFDILVIVSDVDAFLQILVNENDANESAVVIKLRADVPFVLPYEVGMHGTVANIDTWESTWSADVIDRLEYYQSSGDTGRVRVLAFT
jgi:hypothetical protein